MSTAESRFKTMLLNILSFFVLKVCAAKDNGSSSTIDDTISENLLHPSDLSFVSDKVCHEVVNVQRI